jgi:transcriptional regulator with XRE-family HTH domain
MHGMGDEAGRLRRIREERRLTREELARRASEANGGRTQVSYHTIVNLEARQDGANPTWETLFAVSTALGVPVSAIWPPEPSGEPAGPEVA